MIIYDATGKLILDVVVDDNSYRNRAIKGDHNLTLYYSLAEHVEIPVGSYCEFEGERYALMRPEQFKMKHSRLYDYTVTFESDQGKAKIWKFRNPVDGRLKFPLTAKPKEHLQMFVDNMNRHDSGWTVGDCLDDVEKLISYDHDYCWDALNKQASEFKTEFEIVGKCVSLHKVEYNKSDPLPLSYGRGNGFKPGVGRSNSGDNVPTEILFVQGGDRNIDRSKYPEDEVLRASSNGCLLLPVGQSIGYDGEHFEDETGYNAAVARHYKVDDLGLSIRNIDRIPTTSAEDSLDRSDDYPKRVGTISQVVEVDKAKNLYDFIDSSIPAELNYEDYLIGEEQMTVVFQSGELAGREFDVKYYHEPKTINGKNKAGRRFEIVPQEIDGVMMPGAPFMPKTGDTYAVFNVMLPSSYIRNDADRSGASWDMFRAAVKHLFDNEEMKFSFAGELDGLWAKKEWNRICGKIRLGGFIRFSSEQFEKTGVLVRIISIKDYINRPHSPKIELSNETVSGSVSTTLRQLESETVVNDENHRNAIQFTKRRFRDAKETIEMLEEALSDNFTNRINPIAVETMSLLVGDERLQFRFVAQPGSTTAVSHNIVWNAASKQLHASAGTIQHLTLGIDSIRPSHKPDEFLYWQIADFTSPRLMDGSVRYYLYIRAPRQYTGIAGNAVFRLETAAHKIEEGAYYWLLVGILNTEYDGTRSFATLYGFTEILPGRITTKRIVSENGDSFIDLFLNQMKLGDALDYNCSGDNALHLKFLFSENANIANFIFRNQRLESSSMNIDGTPKIILDGNTGNAFFDGSIVNPFKRIKESNLADYVIKDVTGEFYIDLKKTGMRIVCQFTQTQALGVLGEDFNSVVTVPTGTDYIGTELEIMNLSSDALPLTGDLIWSLDGIKEFAWDNLIKGGQLTFQSSSIRPGEYIKFRCLPLIKEHFENTGGRTSVDGFIMPWILVERKIL